MLQLTMADAKRAIQSANAAHAKLRGMREKGEEAVGEVIASATSAGAGYLLGMINGAGVFKDSRIFSVPLELAAAITFHGARVLGLGGKHGAHPRPGPAHRPGALGKGRRGDGWRGDGR